MYKWTRLVTEVILPNRRRIASTQPTTWRERLPVSQTDDVEDSVPEWTPTQIYETTARHLACFVGKMISYMVIETRGKQHFATPRNRVLQKSVFQDLQHFEQGEDQGNR